ncbi:hypothetical protein [Streptomyces sp. NBC_00102]|uniref:hypothetical protein n=1 Tax=Streptomyces sp. NBC_00102 TaxID=2975652 RepID=UPI002256FB41|nr:hypothetical protein [Streptomyces sp. NBC_00102]MCX5396264.1 hypothetical protein [Streptomyces sp. NBC_00102]
MDTGASLPPPGTVLVDTGEDGEGARIGEFRGLAGGYWALRPIGGGREWEADPRWLRAATTQERMRAGVARDNARSRGIAL